MTNTPYNIARDNCASYIGDMNLTYGGYFIRIDESRCYAEVIEYIDASNAGVDGETWVECKTIPLDVANLAQWRSALAYIGLKPSALVGMSRTHKAVELAYALCVYGLYDTGRQDTLIDATDAQLIDDAAERLAAL